MSNNHIERNVCPEEFAERLTEAGGLNRYDEPNFRMIWGMTHTFRAGGIWSVEGQPFFRGYRDLLIGFGDPCWSLQQWQPPERYGTPESYYVQNYDEESGLQTLGEYPYRGRYETVLPLIYKYMHNGKLVVEHMPLNSLLVDLIVPIIKEAEGISFAKRRLMIEERRAAHDKQQVARIESRLADAYPAFGSAPRSASRLACNSVVQKKSEEIERHWLQAVTTIKSRGKGLSIGAPR